MNTRRLPLSPVFSDAVNSVESLPVTVSVPSRPLERCVSGKRACPEALAGADTEGLFGPRWSSGLGSRARFQLTPLRGCRPPDLEAGGGLASGSRSLLDPCGWLPRRCRFFMALLGWSVPLRLLVRTELAPLPRDSKPPAVPPRRRAVLRAGPRQPGTGRGQSLVCLPPEDLREF